MSAPAPVAQARGGPLDGRLLEAPHPDDYEVVMADGSRHRYRRSSDTVRGAVQYDWLGRH